MLLTAIVFLLILNFLVIVHELGHFVTARRFGVRVEEFGLGFPPRLWGRRIGGTTYTINLIPFGGFVRLLGEDGQERTNPTSFSAQAIWRRVVIIVGGVAINFLIAAAVFSATFGFGFPSVLDGTPPGATVRDHRVTIAAVVAGSPADDAGLRPGTNVLTVNGQSVETIPALQQAIQAASSSELAVEYKGEPQTLSVTPVVTDSGLPQIGVELVETGLVQYPFHLALLRGVQTTVSYTGAIFASLGDFVMRLVQWRGLSPDLAGPVGIAVITGQVVDLGPLYVLQFLGLLSLSLAVMNVLPIPALDGGRLFFLLLEAIRRRAVDQRTEQLVHAVGFYALLLLILFISIRDVQRFAVFDAVRRAFQSVL